MAEFGADTITIGGESSGAHLAVVTLLRLRDRHGVALSGANLIFGFYDLTLTPSARLFGDDRVAPRTTELRSYVKTFVKTAQRRVGYAGDITSKLWGAR